MNTNHIYYKKDLISVLPHQGKMLLIDRIIFTDTEKRELISEIDIEPSSVFFDPGIGGIPSWVSFEYMAQSISALSGISGAAAGGKPKPGVILSVTNFAACIPFFKEGETITVKVAESCRVDSVFTFDCTVYTQDSTATAAGTLTVMETDSIEQMSIRRF